MGNSYDSLHQVGSSPDAARASLGGGTAIVVMGVCSIVILLGVASVIFGLRRRRRHRRSNSTGDLCPSDVADIRMETPTDFMNNLASLDRCQSIDEILEKRRRAVWTLEMFDNHGSDFVQSNREDDDDERGISPNSVS